MKSCAVVYNPKSGKGNKKDDFVKYTKEVLKKNDYHVTFFKTEKAGDATKIIAELEDTYDLVIVAGGDGTLNEGITGNLMRKRKLVLAHLPVGTVNDVGTMYGYTKEYKKDLDLLLNGAIKSIDVCLINERPFVYVACLGNYVDVSYATPRNLKEKFGRWGYLLYGARKIKEKIKQYHIEYEVDGIKSEGKFSFLFITNSSRVAGINNIYQDVKLNDQMFEVAFCKVKRKTELIKMIPSLLTMRIKKIPKVTYFRAHHLKIHFKEPLLESWCIDGEEFSPTKNEFEFRVISDMEMLVPLKNIQKLFNEEEG